MAATAPAAGDAPRVKSATYLRNLDHAERATRDLRQLLLLDELTVTQLAQAIGLTAVAQRALLRAMETRHTEGDVA